MTQEADPYSRAAAARRFAFRANQLPDLKAREVNAAEQMKAAREEVQRYRSEHEQLPRAARIFTAALDLAHLSPIIPPDVDHEAAVARIGHVSARSDLRYEIELLEMDGANLPGEHGLISLRLVPDPYSPTYYMWKPRMKVQTGISQVPEVRPEGSFPELRYVTGNYDKRSIVIPEEEGMPPVLKLREGEPDVIDITVQFGQGSLEIMRGWVGWQPEPTQTPKPIKQHELIDTFFVR